MCKDFQFILKQLTTLTQVLQLIKINIYIHVLVIHAFVLCLIVSSSYVQINVSLRADPLFLAYYMTTRKERVTANKYLQ